MATAARAAGTYVQRLAAPILDLDVPDLGLIRIFRRPDRDTAASPALSSARDTAQTSV